MASIQDVPGLSDWDFAGSSKYSLDDLDPKLAEIEKAYYRSSRMADHRGYKFVYPESGEEQLVFLYRMDNNPGGESKHQKKKREFAIDNGIIGLGWGEHVRQEPSNLEQIIQDFYDVDDPNSRGVGAEGSFTNESLMNFLLWMNVGDIAMIHRRDGHRIFARVRSDVKYLPTSDLPEEKKEEFRNLGFWFFRYVDFLGIPQSDVPREFTNRPEMKTVARIKNIGDTVARNFITKFDNYVFDKDTDVVYADRISHQVDYTDLIRNLWSMDDEALIRAIGGGDGLEELVVSYVQRVEDAVVMSKSAPKFKADIEVLLHSREAGKLRPRVIGVQSKGGSLSGEDLHGFLNEADHLYVFSNDTFKHEKATNISTAELANYIRTNPSDIPLPVVENLSKHYT